MAHDTVLGPFVGEKLLYKTPLRPTEKTKETAPRRVQCRRAFWQACFDEWNYGE